MSASMQRHLSPPAIALSFGVMLATVGTVAAAPASSAATGAPTAGSATVAASQTFAPTADTYADSITKTTNYASATTLRLNTDLKYTRIPYLSFTVAGVPAGATNVKAALKLRATVTRTFTVRANATTAFTASTLTWNSRPVVGAVVATGTKPVAGADMTLDVSSAVKGNGAVNLALTASGTAQGSTYFASSEATANKPALTVTYDVPTENPMLIGSSAKPHNGRTTIAQEVAFLDANVGALEIRRVYDGGFDQNFMNRSAMDVGKRATHYSFKPDMGSLAAGSLDQSVRNLLATIPAGHKTILTIWHEPENDFTTAESQATYRKGWQRFSTLVRASGRAELTTSWVMMSYSWRSVSGRQPLNWWPGDGVVDSVGIDTYNEGSLTGTSWNSPGKAFNQPYPGESGYSGGYVDGGIPAFLALHKAKFGIAEFGTLENTTSLTAGWTTTPNKAAWLREAVDYYNRLGAIYVEYFHSGPYRGPWWLDSSPASMAAYKDVVTKF